MQPSMVPSRAFTAPFDPGSPECALDEASVCWSTFCLIDADDVADVLVLVLGGVDGL